MTRDDIIRMAREANWHDELLAVTFAVPLLERFAALVAAAEREALVAIINDNTDRDGVCCTDDLLAAVRARREK